MADDFLPRRGAHWLHLFLLLVVISALEIGRSAMGGTSEFMVTAITRSLYVWLPTIGGIAISIGGPNARVTRNGLLVAVVVVAMMVGLDLTGSLGYAGGQAAALYPDASVMAQASQEALMSWVQTSIDWLRGDLRITPGLNQAYRLDDPRLRAAQAFSDGPLVLVVLASVGFVIAAMSWVRAHVVFKQAQDSKTAYIVLAWLIAPLVVGLARRFSSQERARVLFRGSPVWQPAVSHVVVTLIAVFLWWYTRRYREPGDA
jgi:hypothetical protein